VKRCCIRGAEVLADASQPRAEKLDIWIEGGKIAALTLPGSSPHFAGEVEVLDGKETLAIPGLLNGHTHSYSSLVQGSVKGEPLDLFVIRAMARRAPEPERAAYVGAALHSMAMLKRGITATIDHVRHGLVPSVEGIESVFDAYRETGIRAWVAPMYEDRTYIESLPVDAQALPAEARERLRSAKRPPPREYFAVMEDLAKRWRNVEGRLDLLLGVDGPQRCTPELLEMTGDFARRHTMGLHTHLLEAKTQHLMAPREHGGSFVRYLDRFGLVNERSSFAHFVWCTPEDIALAAERRVMIVHNPLSNLALGSGIQPTMRLLRAGVDVALGTDGQGSAAVSILEQAKISSLMSRVASTDPAQWLEPQVAFGLAAHGASIAPGKPADIALIDTGGPAWRPRGELYHHLVMYESGANVRHVLVEGEVVLRDGRCTRIDEAAILEEAQAISADILRSSEKMLSDAERDAPHVMKLLVDALGRPTDLNRFAELR
jgi:cytosine/adenosine deaminase-related metal-dependent hydrolase